MSGRDKLDDESEPVDYEDQFEEPDEYEAFDCHMGRDGLCGAAGSEDCEFECPYRRDQYARERAAKEHRKSRQGDLLK